MTFVILVRVAVIGCNAGMHPRWKVCPSLGPFKGKFTNQHVFWEVGGTYEEHVILYPDSTQVQDMNPGAGARIKVRN